MTLQVALRSTSYKSQFPMDGPMLFEEEQLEGSDLVQISVFQALEEIGSVEFQLSDQFPTTLEGEFDMWFKLTETTFPSSPEKSPSNTSPTKQARIRVAVKLREVATRREKVSPKKRVEIPEGLTQCPRCDFLEKLTAAQQNELQSLEESYSAYTEVAQVLESLSESHQKPTNSELESMAIELPKVFRSQSGAMNAQEADHMRMVLLGLNEKLKALQVLQREVQTLRLQLQDSHDLRKDLEQSIRETTEQLSRQAEKEAGIHEHLIQERQSAVEALRQQHLRWKEKCEDEEKLQTELSKVKGLLTKQLAENGNFVQMKAHLEALKAELKEAEHQRQILRQQYSKSTQEFETRAKDNQLSISRLVAEKLQVQTELDRVSSALEAQKADTDRVSQEVLQLKTRVSQLDAQLVIAATQRQMLAEVKSLSDSTHTSAVALEAKLQESAANFQKRLDAISDLNLTLQNNEAKVKTSMEELEVQLQARVVEVQQLTREKLDLTANIATLEQMLCVQEDLNQVTETVTTQNDMNVAMKDQLLKELGAMSQSLLQQSERGLSSTRLLTRMRELMEDKEFEIDILRRMVTELQRQRPTYIPVKV